MLIATLASLNLTNLHK